MMLTSMFDRRAPRVRLPMLAIALALCGARVSAQQAAPMRSFTLEDVLSAPFPTELQAAPSSGRFAWIANARGSRNIWVASPAANGSYTAHALTSYSGDDGQELQSLMWRPDGTGLVYVRGSAANPQSLAMGAPPTQVWTIALTDTAPRLIGEGQSPALSPVGDLVAYRAHGGITIARLDGAPAPDVVVHERGADGAFAWSPDGKQLAFVSHRGDHDLIGLYDRTTKSLRWLSAGVDNDENPIWSPDGRQVAFIRVPTGSPGPFSSDRTGQPWSIWAADASTGAAREIWHASAGTGSVFHDLEGGDAFAWGADDHIVFPWERTGWVHLYSISAQGGSPVLLSPGQCEVFSAELSPDRREVVYAANQPDLDHRHIYRVPVTGGTPVSVTTGSGIEDLPVVASDGQAVAFLRADARLPMRPAVATHDGAIHDLAPDAIPESFPASQLVAPETVIFHSADGLAVHAQLFLPPHASAGARHPALLFFHGGPYRQMLPAWNPMDAYTYMYGMNQYFASRGYIVLSVNYRGGTGYGLDFRVPPRFGPSGASEFTDVLGAAHYLKSRSDVDSTRLGVWGGSYGGYLTALALARASATFAAGVDYAGVHDWGPVIALYASEGAKAPSAAIAHASSPIASIDKWRSPVLVIQADDDHNVPFGQTVQLVDALRAHNVPHELIVLPDEIHDLLLFRSWLTYFHAQSDFFDAHLQRPREGGVVGSSR